MDTSTLRSLNLVVTWFGACYVALIFSVLMLGYLSVDHLMTKKVSDFRLYAALPANNIESTDQITFDDARVLIVKDFFAEHNSPLVDSATTFITAADKYNLDFRLLPAISMQESNGGKRVIQNSYNPFGYGIYGSKAVHFESWDEGIMVVAEGLRENYLNKGLITPYEIMTKYTPSSESKGSPWAIGVTHFMEELK